MAKNRDLKLVKWVILTVFLLTILQPANILGINQNDVQSSEQNDFLLAPDQNSVSKPLNGKDLNLLNIGMAKVSTVSVTSSIVGFISKWNTSLPGATTNNQIQLPLESVGDYNFTVFWGDGLHDNITTWNDVKKTHTYSVAGVYTLNITGKIIGWTFGSVGDPEKIIEISQWGELQLGNSGSYFWGGNNLNLTTIDTLNLTGTTNLNSAFRYCFNLGRTGNLNNWDVSKVTDMSAMFAGASTFNQPLTNWEVSNVTSMNSMFSGAKRFNQSLNTWNVSSVTNFRGVFNLADDFNQPLDNWDVSNGLDMYAMFTNTMNFNQPIGNWNVSSVTNMNNMFYNAISFNQSIEYWNTSKVTNTVSMFSKAFNFNQPIDNWDVSGITSTSNMFEYATSFNQPLESWNVTGVTDMKYMFRQATSFDQPLGGWNVSSVTNMANMFYQTEGLSYSNYDDLLTGWAALPLQSNLSLHAGGSRYSTSGATAKNTLINTFNWTITDAGQITVPTQPQSVYVAIGNNHLNLTWYFPSDDGGTPVTSYNIYRSETSDSGHTFIASVSGTTFFYHDDTVSNGNTYYYIIRAENVVGESSDSVEESGTPISPPSTPQNVQTSPGLTYVNLTWSAPLSDGGSPITKYNIYRSTTTGSGFSFYDNAGITLFEYHDTNVEKGQVFYYIIRSVNTMGESIDSVEVNGTVFNFPSAPQTLEASVDSDSVTLTWIAPSDNGGDLISRYDIYRSTTSGSDYTSIDSVGSTILTYIDLTANPDQEYFYAVRAVNSVGQSIDSNEVSATLTNTDSSTTDSNPSSNQTTQTSTPNSGGSGVTSSPGFEILAFFISLTIMGIIMRRRVGNK